MFVNLHPERECTQCQRRSIQGKPRWANRSEAGRVAAQADVEPHRPTAISMQPTTVQAAPCHSRFRVAKRVPSGKHVANRRCERSRLRDVPIDCAPSRFSVLRDTLPAVPRRIETCRPQRRNARGERGDAKNSAAMPQTSADPSASRRRASCASTPVSRYAAPRPDGDAVHAQHHALADDQSEHRAAAGAERHADADFGGALPDDRREHAVEPDRREHDGDRREDRRSGRARTASLAVARSTKVVIGSTSTISGGPGSFASFAHESSPRGPRDRRRRARPNARPGCCPTSAADEEHALAPVARRATCAAGAARRRSPRTSRARRCGSGRASASRPPTRPGTAFRGDDVVDHDVERVAAVVGCR